jgi:hypothetical protein
MLADQGERRRWQPDRALAVALGWADQHFFGLARLLHGPGDRHAACIVDIRPAERGDLAFACAKPGGQDGRREERRLASGVDELGDLIRVQCFERLALNFCAFAASPTGARIYRDQPAIHILHGTPELIEAVERGEIKNTPAERVAALPPDEQRAALATGNTADRKPRASRVARTPAEAAAHVKALDELPESESEYPLREETRKYVKRGGAEGDNDKVTDGPAHIVGDIRVWFDKISARLPEILALPKDSRVELLQDFGRLLGLVKPRIEEKSGISSALSQIGMR